MIIKIETRLIQSTHVPKKNLSKLIERKKKRLKGVRKSLTIDSIEFD